MPKTRKEFDKHGNKLFWCVTCSFHLARYGQDQCEQCKSKGLDPVKDRAKWVSITEAQKLQQTFSFE